MGWPCTCKDSWREHGYSVCRLGLSPDQLPQSVSPPSMTPVTSLPSRPDASWSRSCDHSARPQIWGPQALPPGPTETVWGE